MNEPVDLIAQLQATRLVAIVRGDDPGAILSTVVTLVDEGITLVEVSLSSPSALEALQAAAREVESVAILGAGTIVSRDLAHRAIDAGARFGVTPHSGEGAQALIELGCPALIGALTPTEIFSAFTAGAAAVKVFPASMGGVAYVKALRDPYPNIPIVPVGGVDVTAFAAYLNAGAVAAGVGRPLVGDAASGGDLTQLRSRTRHFLEIARTAP